MNSLMLIQSQSLGIDFDFHNKLGNVLIASSLVILALSEVAINNDDLDYWNIDERLNKHRTVKDFDVHVQKMLYFLKAVGPLKASVIKSSSNNYNFVEFNDVSSGACIRVLHTFNPKARYMKKYLKMNEDPNKPRFAYIQYSLDSSKTKVQKVKAVIPSSGGKVYKSLDLLQKFEYTKHNLGVLQREDVNKTMHLLNTSLGTIALTENANT